MILTGNQKIIKKDEGMIMLVGSTGNRNLNPQCSFV
jgi:hypothetical protein